MRAPAEVSLFVDPADGDAQYAIKHFDRSLLRRRRHLTKRPAPGGGGGAPGRPSAVVSALDQVEGEVALMKKLEHPNCVRLFEV